MRLNEIESIYQDRGDENSKGGARNQIARGGTALELWRRGVWSHGVTGVYSSITWYIC